MSVLLQEVLSYIHLSNVLTDHFNILAYIKACFLAEQ